MDLRKSERASFLSLANTQQRTLLRICLVCILVFSMNFSSFITYDTIPTSLLGFNLLENWTLYFDSMTEAQSRVLQLGFKGVETKDGHLVPFYPPGTAFLTFPIYVIYYGFLKILGVSIEVTSSDFEPIRQGAEKVTATFLATLTVLCFYLLSIKYFPKKVALITTFTFAFGTGTWTHSSQNLWQHGASNALLLFGVLLLLSLDAERRGRSVFMALVAGCICGFLPCVRPSSGLFSLSFLAFVALRQRPRLLWFLLGTVVGALPGTFWNLYFFDHILGGYYVVFSGELIEWEFLQSVNRFFFLLFHPLRGLFVFSPVLLFIAPGVLGLLRSIQSEERSVDVLTLALFLSSMGLLLFLSLNRYWHGGFSFGPRYLLDTMVVLCFLLNYALSGYVGNNNWLKQKAYGLLLFLSVGIQFCGAFNFSPFLWKGVPIVEKIHFHFDQDQPIPDNMIVAKLN